MTVKTPPINIVVLDRDGLPKRISIAKPDCPHNWTEYAQTSNEQIVDRSKGAHIVVTNKVPITENTLKACPSIRHIAVTATGYNIVDIHACEARGVSVSNVPSYAANTVSEHVIGTTIVLKREILRYATSVEQGKWQQSKVFCLFDKPFNDIAGTTIGLIGLGEIGQATALKAHSLGMKVVFTSRSQKQSKALHFARQLPLDALLKESDVISVHCSLNPSTHDLIASDQLSLMKDGAILVNTARGGIVNEIAVVEAIKSNKLGGIAFDVLETEPPLENSPLLQVSHLPNVILTPHIAWASDQAMQYLANIVSNNITAFVSGSPINLVTKH